VLSRIDDTEFIMRITVHLDTFDRVCPCGYAILEISKQSHRWTCENQLGLALPKEGTSVATSTGTLLCAQAEQARVCLLEGLDAFADNGPFEGETGLAMWYGNQGIQPAAGHWHVELAQDCDERWLSFSSPNESE
jgi:hypothetical protein